jgi:Kef-type K+ transport system membrane component KefB/nucleotide-binding universal stress UspA family protein
MSFLLMLLLQVAVILVVARGVGWLFRRVHQPQVVGEMAAGIMLGPSLLGWLAPGVSGFLFAPDRLAPLDTLSQVGLVLFMFMVGLEFDPRLLRGRRNAVATIGSASIVVPFLLGTSLALWLYPRLSDDSVSLTGFALFMGSAMSVTAFPVLARILTERNLLGTKVGALTIACAAVGDVTAWGILAVVIAIVNSSAAETPLALTLGGSLVFIGVLVTGVRRALGWLESFYHTRGRMTQDMMAVVLLLLLASAWTTEWLGIHALFGAFAMGAVMPKDPGFVHDLTDKLEDLTVVFLLPLFFAFTGLRTSIGLVSGGEMWMYFGLVLLVAVAGKFGGSTLAARATALPWREAGALGVLMNTRGLMELVILNIGLELGVISPALFTMMVLMALVTTAMTTPLLEWIYPARLIRESAIGGPETGVYTVLIPVSLSHNGPGLLRAARALVPAGRSARIYALYLDRVEDQSLTHMPPEHLPAEEPALQPLLAEAARVGVEVRSLTLSSYDVAKDIVEVARAKRADLVVLGWHKSVLKGPVLGGGVSDALRAVRCDIALLLERGKEPWKRVLIPQLGLRDAVAAEVARRVEAEGSADVTILRVLPPPDAPARSPQARSSREGLPAAVRLEVVEAADPTQALLGEAACGYDVVVVHVADAPGPAAFGALEERLVKDCATSLLLVRFPAERIAATPAGSSPDASPVTRAAS